MKQTDATKTKSLIITKASKQKLTKNQEEFNKLTTRIEKLQKEIEKRQYDFDIALQTYGELLHPLKDIILKNRRSFLLALWPNFIENRLAAKDQQILKVILKEMLQHYFMELTTPPDAEIKKIFTALEGTDYDKVYKKEKDEARKEILAELKRRNIDITDVNTKDIDALHEKLEAHFQELRNKEWNNNEEPSKEKKTKQKLKSAKQIAAEELELEIATIKQKNIATIYKQLAKLFHPDLEQDESRKQEKVMLMQELTAAYEAKNLHALLTLELRWIHKENDHLETLTEEKLAVYLQILKEQVQELNDQKTAVFYLPQYNALREAFGWEIQQRPLQVVNKHIIEMQLLKTNLVNNVALLQEPQPLKHVKQMVKTYKKQQQQMEEDEFMRSYFNN